MRLKAHAGGSRFIGANGGLITVRGKGKSKLSKRSGRKDFKQKKEASTSEKRGEDKNDTGDESVRRGNKKASAESLIPGERRKRFTENERAVSKTGEEMIGHLSFLHRGGFCWKRSWGRTKTTTPKVKNKPTY